MHWKDMANSEKEYKRCKNSSSKRYLRQFFIEKQAKFDKLLRKSERTYNRQLADKIENLNSENPQQFWEQIKYLGPKECKKTLCRV